MFQKELIATVNAIVKKCPKSLIIFDEIHEMCPSVLDTIKPMLDHHEAVDGVDYRWVCNIFVLHIIVRCHFAIYLSNYEPCYYVKGILGM